MDQLQAVKELGEARDGFMLTFQRDLCVLET